MSQQPENWENRNGPDLVQAFRKKWWVESDFNNCNKQTNKQKQQQKQQLYTEAPA
jgi:hypothetical protein